MDSPGNRALRGALHELVARHARPGAPVLDFGCGTGLDAGRLADAGHPVLAYDVSDGMLARLRERCARHIASGRVVAAAGPDLAATLEAFDPVEVLVSNFGVLNLLRDLTELAELSARLTALRAAVLGVQNPFYPRDMRRGWWWRGAAALPVAGSVDYEGEVPTRRHLVSRYGAALGTDFVLSDQRSVVRGVVRARFPLNRLGAMRVLAFRRLR